MKYEFLRVVHIESSGAVCLMTVISDEPTALHLHGTLKIKVAVFSELFVLTYRTITCHSPMSCNIENKKMSQDDYGKAYRGARCIAWLILSLSI